MDIDLRLPNITSNTADGKMAQMQSYMYQLVQQLNWALKAIDSAGEGGNGYTNTSSSNGSKSASSEDDAISTFNSIKSLIIKSADIIKAYEETWDKDFNGKYFAQSDFGTYLLETKNSIETNSTGVKETYTNVQKITNEDGTGTLDILADNIRTTDAYIKRGLLYYDDYGNARYGVEVGETLNGNFSKFARFISDRLSFFDGNGNEVAYISDQRLYITDAIFLGTLQFGKYKADTSDGLAFTWIGG